MKKIILFLFSALLTGGLVSCGNDASLKVTFDARREESKPLTLVAGSDNKITQTDEVKALTENYPYHVFKNWYKSLDAAKTLDDGENNENIYTFSETISSSFTVYAGYEETYIDAATKKKIDLTLGVYQTLGYSSLPLLENTPYENLKDDYSFKAVGVKDEQFKTYKDTLVKAGFQETSLNKFLDKLGRYFVSFLYENDELTYTISFNDEVGEFPANFLGTMSPALDASLYLDPSQFSLVKNELGEDKSKKFIVSQKETSLLGQGKTQAKTVYYMPKDNDEEPDKSFGDYLSNNGFSLASSSSLTYVDMFLSSMVTVNVVSDDELLMSPSLTDLGVKKGMVEATFYPKYTTSLNRKELANYYQKLTGKEYPSSFPEWGKIGKAFSLLNGYSSGNNYGPGFFVSGASKANFDAVMKELYSQGYTYSKSEGTYSTSFTFISSTGEHHIHFTYYDSSKVKGLFSDLCQVVIIRAKSVYETLSEWLSKQNVGGGSLASIPSLPGTSVTGGKNSSYPYMYTLMGEGVSESDFLSYQNALTEEGFVSEGEKEGYYYYHTRDNYYNLALRYDTSTSYLYLVISYNAYSKGKFSANDLLLAAKKRLAVDELIIPGLSEWIGEEGKELTAMSFYDGSSQRILFYENVPLEETSKARQTALLEVINKDSSWENVGSNSSGITFYKNADNVYLYTTTMKEEKEDGTTTYSFVLGLYK